MTVYQSLGAEWTGGANDFRTEQQVEIKALPNGGYVIAWVDGNDGQNNVRAQIFTASGVPVGAEFIVNAPTASGEFKVKSNIDIEILGNGNFVIAWDQTFAGTNGNGVLARVFDASGQPLGQEFLAGTYSNATHSGAREPQILAAGGDEFWVISTSAPPHERNGLFSQKVDSEGNILTPRTMLNQPRDRVEVPHGSEALVLTDGRILVSWQEYAYNEGNTAVTTSLLARLFDSSFAPLTEPFSVAALPNSEGTEISAAALPGGGFAFSWSQAGSAPGGYDTMLRRFDADGVGAAAQVVDAGRAQGANASSLAVLADGALLVSWARLPADRFVADANVYGQLFDAAGASLGEAFLLTNNKNNNSVEVAALADGSFAVTFLGGNVQVFGQSFGLTSGTATATDDVIIARPDHSTALNGLAGDDVLNGNALKNTLTGGNGDDILFGNGGNDALNGGAGADTMDGGIGNDSYTVDSLFDRVIEAAGGGTDTVKASVNYTLGDHVENLTLTGKAALNGTGNEGNNKLTGNSGANTLQGGMGNDTILGGLGDDHLIGGDNNDLLTGGAGQDVLTGGAGLDRFIFLKTTDTATSAALADTITDFTQGQDKIDLAKIDANTLTSASAFTFIGTNAFFGGGAAGAGQLRYEQIGSQTHISGDVNGDGVADFLIKLDNLVPLQAGDFIL